MVTMQLSSPSAIKFKLFAKQMSMNAGSANRRDWMDIRANHAFPYGINTSEVGWLAWQWFMQGVNAPKIMFDPSSDRIETERKLGINRWCSSTRATAKIEEPKARLSPAHIRPRKLSASVSICIPLSEAGGRLGDRRPAWRSSTIDESKMHIRSLFKSQMHFDDKLPSSTGDKFERDRKRKGRQIARHSQLHSNSTESTEVMK